MNKNAMAAKRPTLLRALATKLTTASYPIASRHGMKNFWVELAIDLWTALDDRLKHLEADLACAGYAGWRERLAAELTDTAYRLTLEYGVLGSFLELELDLYHAFCHVVDEIEPMSKAGSVLQVG
jgi:hypothetical protein